MGAFKKDLGLELIVVKIGPNVFDHQTHYHLQNFLGIRVVPFGAREHSFASRSRQQGRRDTEVFLLLAEFENGVEYFLHEAGAQLIE